MQLRLSFCCCCCCCVLLVRSYYECHSIGIWVLIGGKMNLQVIAKVLLAVTELWTNTTKYKTQYFLRRELKLFYLTRKKGES